jgi:hypothetical protein
MGSEAQMIPKDILESLKDQKLNYFQKVYLPSSGHQSSMRAEIDSWVLESYNKYIII